MRVMGKVQRQRRDNIGSVGTEALGMFSTTLPKAVPKVQYYCLSVNILTKSIKVKEEAASCGGVSS